MADVKVHTECGFRVVTPPEVDAAKRIACTLQFTFLDESDARRALSDLLSYVDQMPIAGHFRRDKTVSDRVAMGCGLGSPLSPEFVGLSEADYVRTTLQKRLRKLLARCKDPKAQDLEDIVMEILATQEQASDSLLRYKREADEHFRSESYMADVEQLRLATEDIQGLRIGLDLEGVLVNLNPLSRMDFNELRMWTVLDPELQSQRMKWIFRRPLAKEWIQMLAENNSVDICTAVFREHALSVLEQTGIDIPLNSKLVAKDDLERMTGEQPGIYMKLDELNRGLSLSDPLSAQAITNAYDGRIKIPSFLNYDVIVDDNADMHRRACELLGYSEDARRIMDVSPFKFLTAKELSELFRERGILGISLRLKDYCTLKK